MSHPSIIDGWFRETSPLWPGQAMSLQVKKVLHTEQSKFQDVLVFESEKHGNVLVLDGAIQCVEHDEFAYQEMISHLPLSSHPNPKRVLIIGGGDGGVLREILKHPSVEKVILCDIDEAVPRVSKLFLKDMAKFLEDSRVEVRIGDGAEFLKEVGEKIKSSGASSEEGFDVIITDSSDPSEAGTQSGTVEGSSMPADTLFQSSYFSQLYNALNPGGTISTQGECVWLHLPLISSLIKSVKKVFPNVEYASASTPTYPSGMIGFIVASKDAGRDLKSPVKGCEWERALQGKCKFWNDQVHKSAFVLPEFARSVVENARLGKEVAAGEKTTGQGKKVLLLGSGFVALPAAEYVLRRPENSLTVGCRTLSAAESLISELSIPSRATPISVDATDPSALESAVEPFDLVISLIPYIHHAKVIRAAIKTKTDVVTTSYVSDEMMSLHDQCVEAGITCINEIGMDPGLDHLWAWKAIDEVHSQGGKIRGFFSFVGGLPAPEAANNPLGYKFSWSARGAILAHLNPAKYLASGQPQSIPGGGSELMNQAKSYRFEEFPAFAFVGYPNRDSTPFADKYRIGDGEVRDLIRGSLRYEGTLPEFIKGWLKIGFLNQEEKDWLKPGAKLTWAEATAKAIGSDDTSESALVDKIKSLVGQDLTPQNLQRFIGGLIWLGVLSSSTPCIPKSSMLDTLCGVLEHKMAYAKGEKDMVILQHRFEIENADGSEETQTTTLLDYGAPFHENQGPSSMARLVGVPCGIAVQMVLDGKLKRAGVWAPYDKWIAEPLLEATRKEGIEMSEVRKRKI